MKKSRVWRYIGHLALVSSSFMVIPYFINKSSSKVYKSFLKRGAKDFDNLGSKTVKRD